MVTGTVGLIVTVVVGGGGGDVVGGVTVVGATVDGGLVDGGVVDAGAVATVGPVVLGGTYPPPDFEAPRLYPPLGVGRGV